MRTSKQTGLYQSRYNKLQKGVRLFRYSHWFPRKAIVKLANGKFLDACRALGRHNKNISNFTKASHPFVAKCPNNMLANFHQNLSYLHTLLIHLKKGNSLENKLWFLGLERFAQFSHLVKADVNTIIVNHAVDQSKMAWGPQRSLVTKPVLVFHGKGHVLYLWIQDEMGKAQNSSRNPAKQRQRNNMVRHLLLAARTRSPCHPQQGHFFSRCRTTPHYF